MCWMVPRFLVLFGVTSAYDTFIYMGFCLLVDLVLGGSGLGWFWLSVVMYLAGSVLGWFCLWVVLS
jgi:hypothetical protein